jgi:hypothetical protein
VPCKVSLCLTREQAQALTGLALAGLLGFRMAPEKGVTLAERQEMETGITAYAELLNALHRHDEEHSTVSRANATGGGASNPVGARRTEAGGRNTSTSAAPKRQPAPTREAHP